MKGYAILMKGYAILLLMVLLITACAKVKEAKTLPEEDITQKPANQPEMPSPPEEVLAAAEEKKIQQETINIDIHDGSFDPVNITIRGNSKVRWLNKGGKEHKIACYIRGSRVATSSNLGQGQSFEYRFKNIGEYTCIDAIYGLRGIITVGGKIFSTPTGSVVLGDAKSSLLTAPLAAIAMLAITAILFFIYGRKRH